MMTIRAYLFFIAFSAINTSCLADIAVVVSPDAHIKNLSKQEITELFFKIRSSTANDVKLTPTDHHNHALKERFYNVCCNRNPLQVKAYWSRLVFSGRARPPEVLPSEKAISDYLKENPLALVYLDAKDVLPSMNVVYTFAEVLPNETP